MSNRSVYFISLGCPKNLVDSEVMLGSMLQKAESGEKFDLAKNPENAEVIIVNTCAFIGQAKKESVDTILEMSEYKKEGTCQKLIVTGCLAQRYPKELSQEMPEVDHFIGTGEYHLLRNILSNPLADRIYVKQPAFIHSENDARLHTGPRQTGYLKISEGCNRRCAFCIIPKLRGNVRSRSVESLVLEARQMAQNGVRELCLVAQDLTEFGMEKKYSENLEMLLPELCQIGGIEWIRLHYVYPDEFSDRLIEIIKNEPKIVKYLDMPIQHTNDRMLKLMNRRLTKVKLFELVEKLRTQIPSIVFRTSVIVGFPGETEEEYQEMMLDFEKLKFDFVGVFQYSPEEGTPAIHFQNPVSEQDKSRRAKNLEKTLSGISARKHNSWIGQSFPVLIEGTHPEEEGFYVGRFPFQAQEIDGNVVFSAKGFTPQIGQLINVEVTKNYGYEFFGQVIA